MSNNKKEDTKDKLENTEKTQEILEKKCTEESQEVLEEKHTEESQEVLDEKNIEGTKEQEKKKKKRTRKIIARVMLVFLLYVVLGALVPFMYQPKVKEEYQQQSNTSRFYNENATSVDRAAIVETSKEALDIRMTMFEEAKERIVLSTFDIRLGESCTDIFSSLLEAADRGVQVQILVDGLYGGIHMKMEPIFYLAGTHENIEIKFYNIPNILLPWTINGRMHDKYILIDDKLLLLGGRNTFDYFLGDYTDKNLSYDREVFIYNTASGERTERMEASQNNSSSTDNVRIEEANIVKKTNPAEEKNRATESVIEEVYAYFDTIWNSKDCKTVYKDTPFWIDKKTLETERDRLEQHYENMKIKTPNLFDKSMDYHEYTVAICKASFINNPIHILAKQPYVWYEITELAQESKERVYLHTPYAVFSKAMYQDITKLIKEENKNITMQVNSTAVGDNVMASSDYTLSRKKLLKTGIKLYEFQGDYSSHGKSALFDSDLSLIGSYNVDMRSTYVDTEVAIVIHGEEFNQLLEEKIMDMEAQSLEVDADGNYIEKIGVEKVELPFGKKILFSITSILFQLIRYLI